MNFKDKTLEELNHVKATIAEELSIALEGINGPLVHLDDITLNSDGSISVRFNDVYEVPEDNYIGIVGY